MARLAFLCLCGISAAALSAELDSVVLADGTVLRGVVQSCGERILFLPRGTELEIALDAKDVRAVHLADGMPCSARRRVVESAPVAAALPPPRTLRRWYGGPLVAMDAGVATLGLLGLAVGFGANSKTGGIALGIAAGSLYAIGPPTLHAIHGGADRAAISVFLRVPLALAGYFAGYALADRLNFTGEPQEDSSRHSIALLGLALGAVTAMIIDDANANENVPAPPTQVSVAPFASPWTGARGLSLSIRF